MTRVTVVHQHTNNYGDDAAGVALVSALRHELDAEVDVFYIWHKNGRKLSTSDGRVRHHMLPVLSGTKDRRPWLALAALTWPWSRVLDRDLALLVDHCRRSDAVFVAPAGSNLGVYKDWMYLLTLLILVRSGVRPRFVQNTVAPSGSWIFDRLACFVLRRSEVAVREAASARWLASRHIGAYLGVDTAFLLEQPAEAVDPAGRASYIALVPTTLGSWHPAFRQFDDDAFLTDVLVRAVAAVASPRALDVVLVPHLTGPEAEHSLHDRALAALTASGVRARIADVDCLDDYRDALTGALAVVSMRYHGLVLSGLAGVPCVALSYENKMREAATYLGLVDLELDMHEVDEPALRSRLLAALEQGDAVAGGLEQRVQVLRSIAAGPVHSARSELLRRRASGSDGR